MCCYNVNQWQIYDSCYCMQSTSLVFLVWVTIITKKIEPLMSTLQLLEVHFPPCENVLPSWLLLGQLHLKSEWVLVEIKGS